MKTIITRTIARASRRLTEQASQHLADIVDDVRAGKWRVRIVIERVDMEGGER